MRSLLDLGHEVALFTASPSVRERWTAQGPLLRVSVVPYRLRARTRALDFFSAERAALKSELKSFDADVYHAHWTYEFALACLDAGSTPLLVTAHDAPLTVLKRMPDPYRLVRTIMAVAVRSRINELTAVTPYLADRWRTEMLYRRPIRVVTNPTPDMGSRSDMPPSDLVILDVANGSRLKNVRRLVRAFSTVLKRVPKAELRLVGPGLERGASLHRWAARQGLDTNVHFLGTLPRDALAREYSRASMFCHPSREESQGIALLEAIQFELPIIAGKKSGAVSWTLFDGEAGVLVDVRRTAAIADAIVSVHSNPSLSKARTIRAKSLAAARYSPASVANAYVGEYERLVAGDRKHRQAQLPGGEAPA
ncbi:glycosyltransferase family 4 protein [Curtobacterium sp. MCPF17_001]|uniref:glycosyltransferase family 4 protein n=1 Tax=Curtobacterium sp. MCPF17_001 TaxID=2175651 RepID=UPI0015E8CEAA